MNDTNGTTLKYFEGKSVLQCLNYVIFI